MRCSTRIDANHNEELLITRELQHAVVKRQLELFFQPRIDATTLQVSAVEALLRWRATRRSGWWSRRVSFRWPSATG